VDVVYITLGFQSPLAHLRGSEHHAAGSYSSLPLYDPNGALGHPQNKLHMGDQDSLPKRCFGVSARIGVGVRGSSQPTQRREEHEEAPESKGSPRQPPDD